MTVNHVARVLSTSAWEHRKKLAPLQLFSTSSQLFSTFTETMGALFSHQLSGEVPYFVSATGVNSILLADYARRNRR